MKHESFVLAEISETYTQDVDCCSPESICHTMTIKTQDGGGGAFVVIQTERWAFDLDELKKFVKMCTRLIKQVDKANEASQDAKEEVEK